MEPGYEALLALQKMRDEPNLEASVIAKACECSWDELLEMAKSGYIDLGMERLEQKMVHPVILPAGLDEVAHAEEDGII